MSTQFWWRWHSSQAYGTEYTWASPSNGPELRPPPWHSEQYQLGKITYSLWISDSSLIFNEVQGATHMLCFVPHIQKTAMRSDILFLLMFNESEGGRKWQLAVFSDRNRWEGSRLPKSMFSGNTDCYAPLSYRAVSQWSWSTASRLVHLADPPSSVLGDPQFPNNCPSSTPPSKRGHILWAQVDPPYLSKGSCFQKFPGDFLPLPLPWHRWQFLLLKKRRPPTPPRTHTHTFTNLTSGEYPSCTASTNHTFFYIKYGS